MHLVTRPSMLTLTVERLVGATSGHGRMTMSPDTSDTGSESSVSPVTPHFTAHNISLLLNSDRSLDTINEEGDKCSTCSPGQRSPDYQNLRNEDVSVHMTGREGRMTVDSTVPLSLSPVPSASSSSSSVPLVHQGDNDGQCDDERPPSGASGGSSSTWTQSWGDLRSPPSSTSTIDPHNSSRLKFSIQNILRADFGQRVGTNTQHVSRSHLSNNETRAFERRPRRVSPRNISEDSNSSCASTSRREEVVDEAKVNPEVPKGPLLWPAWVYCTRYSDRPSSGPRSRRVGKKSGSSTVRSQDGHGGDGGGGDGPEEKRPRTAFTAEQLGKLKQEFDENRYLTEKRRQDLARDLKLHENQIKIWFQNKRAKLKKSTGQRGGLALQLMAQGLYNHSTVPMDEDEEDYLPC